ncbi:MAG: InlB B-repeat-containing protein [Bacilli bacterium]|nr:InlB B-repeat-containing protein [Bacilli bacterium]
MKLSKLFKYILCSLIFIISVTIFSFNISIKADPLYTIETVDGASIRTADPMGLRFCGVSSGDYGSDDVNYGFLLTKGNCTKDEIIAKYALSRAVAIDCEEKNGNDEFFVSVVNFPASDYGTNLSALAYVSIDGVKYYADASCVRNIYEVASALISDPRYSDLEYVKKIVYTSNFNFNGGTLEFDDVFNASRFNAGIDDDKINICDDENVNNGSDHTFARIFLKYDNELRCYKVVAYKAALLSLDPSLDDIASSSNASVLEEYDYVLAVNNTTLANYNKIKDLIDLGDDLFDYYFSFTTPTLDNVDNEIKVSMQPELFYTSHSYYKDGDDLPILSKTYYEFDGWCEYENLSGTVYTSHSGDAGKTYYAKFTPVDYTVSYDLQGGSTPVSLVTSYNYETPTITLPRTDLMSIENGEFVGWYNNPEGNGDAILTIPLNSHGNISLYAVWNIFDSSVVSLNPEDLSVITTYSPNKFVKSTFTDGTFTINGNTYTVGDGALYSTIDDAIRAASADDVIYVFSGTYNESFTFTQNVKLLGPNADVSGSNSRYTEAVITGTITTNKDGCEINGFDLSTSGKFSLRKATTIKCIKSTYSGAVGTDFITCAAKFTSLIISDCYANFSSTSRFCYGGTNVITNITITNNEIHGYIDTEDSPVYVEGIYLQKISGTVLIQGNTIDGFDSYAIRLGTATSGNTCSSVIIRDNTITNNGTSNSYNIYIRNVPSTCDVLISYNTIENSLAGLAISVVGTLSDNRIIFEYNKFMDEISGSFTKYITSALSDGNFVIRYNYFATAPTSITVQTTNAITNTYLDANDVPSYIPE